MRSVTTDAFLALVGLAAGGIVSAGTVAFILIIGLVQRIQAKTGTAHRSCFYEDCILVGGTIGNLMFLYGYNIPLGTFACGIIGLCYGVFIGCLIMSLAETMDAFPILCRRTRLTSGLPILITAVALGKSVGCFLYYWMGIYGS